MRKILIVLSIIFILLYVAEFIGDHLISQYFIQKFCVTSNMVEGGTSIQCTMEDINFDIAISFFVNFIFIFGFGSVFYNAIKKAQKDAKKKQRK